MGDNSTIIYVKNPTLQQQFLLQHHRNQLTVQGVCVSLSLSSVHGSAAISLCERSYTFEPKNGHMLEYVGQEWRSQSNNLSNQRGGSHKSFSSPPPSKAKLSLTNPAVNKQYSNDSDSKKAPPIMHQIRTPALCGTFVMSKFYDTVIPINNILWNALKTQTL